MSRLKSYTALSDCKLIRDAESYMQTHRSLPR